MVKLSSITKIERRYNYLKNWIIKSSYIISNGPYIWAKPLRASKMSRYQKSISLSFPTSRQRSRRPRWFLDNGNSIFQHQPNFKGTWKKTMRLGGFWRMETQFSNINQILRACRTRQGEELKPTYKSGRKAVKIIEEASKGSEWAHPQWAAVRHLTDDLRPGFLAGVQESQS